MSDKEKLTFREILIEGVKKFAGEIIGVAMIAGFLWAFPSFRLLFSDYRFSQNEDAQPSVQTELEKHKQEEERPKAELRQREAALKGAEAKKAEEERRGQNYRGSLRLSWQTCLNVQRWMMSIS